MANNLTSRLARAAHERAQAAPDRRCNLAYAEPKLHRSAQRLLMFADEIATVVGTALATFARTIKRGKPQRAAPRNHPRVKAHPSVAHKG